MVQAMQFIPRAQNSFWLTAARPEWGRIQLLNQIAAVDQIPVVHLVAVAHPIAVVVKVECLAYLVARSNTSVI